MVNLYKKESERFKMLFWKKKNSEKPEPQWANLKKEASSERKKITSKELAQGLTYALKKFSVHFYEDFGQRSQSLLGIKLDESQLITLKREIYMINLWIISKVLSPDKKVLDELHKIYLLPHVNENQIKQWLEQKETENLINVLKQDESELHERYTKYYANWNDGGSEQFILAHTMLEYMFNKGQPEIGSNSLFDMALSRLVINHIYGMMNFIMNIRKKYAVVD